MLYLRTFGSVYLVADDGAPITGAAAQRRLLAILAVLAASGDEAVSRDRLLGLLWPEGEPERARHALTQSLYHARKTLKSDELFVGSADLRINPAVLGSDVRDFEEAIRRGDLERAANLQSAPFLDGFYVAGATELERWASEQRARLGRRHAEALDTLADRARAAADWTTEVSWRRRRTELDPLDSRAARQLMEALASAGDPAGAVQHARVHEVLLRDQLDVAPDAAVAALAERLRQERTPVVEHPPVRARIETPELASRGPLPNVIVTGPARWRSRLPLAGAVAVLVMAVLGVLSWQGRSVPPPAPPAAARPALMVAPFRVAGAAQPLVYLKEGMVDLLSTRVASDDVMAVDPGATLRAWRDAGLSRSTEVPRDDAMRVAQRLGASQVIVGSIVGAPRRLVLSATLIEVPSGRVRAEATSEGPSDSLTTLVDRLAVRLLASDAGEGDRLASRTTLSPAALRAYLDAQTSYRRGRHTEAIRRYERALGHDSTFALAALNLIVVANRVDDPARRDRAVALAWAAREALNERDRAVLDAFAGPRYPARSTEAEGLTAWEHAAAVAPDHAEVWHEIGERFFHHGPALGVADAYARARDAFRRALALDPEFTPSRRLLLLAAARAGDTATLGRAATPAALRDSLGDLAPAVSWRVALARGDSVASKRFAESIGNLDTDNLRLIAMLSQYDAVAARDGERATRQLRARGGPGELDAVLARHSMAFNQGRPAIALDLTEDLQRSEPGSRAHLRMRILDALYAEGDTSAAFAAAARLARLAGGAPVQMPAARAVQLADLCVLGQWRLAREGTAAATDIASTIAQLRIGAASSQAGVAAAAPLTCGELLDASLAVVTRQRDALDRVKRLDSLLIGGPAMEDAAAYAHLVVARLHDRLGQPQRALDAIRRRPYLTTWPRYLATARREEGRLASLVGDRDGEIRVYTMYLALREDPEESVAPEVEEVRAALASSTAPR